MRVRKTKMRAELCARQVNVADLGRSGIPGSRE
jgi:hypothetical protein